MKKKIFLKFLTFILYILSFSVTTIITVYANDKTSDTSNYFKIEDGVLVAYTGAETRVEIPSSVT